jgi:UMF1 family MFS transporter
MGGTQSQSRSAFASIIPGKKDNASYFSFYELTEKVAIFIGTLSYGILIQITGGMRNSVILLASFFIAGLFFMWKLQIANKKNQWKPMP